MKEKFWTDEAGIDEFLREGEVGCLTTLDAEGWPHSVPVNYVWLRRSVFFHSGSGQKMANLERRPKAAFAVIEVLSAATGEITGESDPCRDSQLGRSVLIRGLAREIKEPDLKLEILDALIAKYDPRAERLGERYPDTAALAARPFFAACRLAEIKTVSLTARRLLLEKNSPAYRAEAAARLQKRGLALGSVRDIKSALLLRPAGTR